MTEQSSAPSRRQPIILPALEVLDELLSYDPKTGVIRWRKAMFHGRIPAGTIAGYVNAKGYRYIGINGIDYLEHRLAFYIHHRREPIGDIDHRDVVPSNNRIGNLREASPSMNGYNKKIEAKNTSGVKGVSWDKHKGRWYVRLQANGKDHYGGYFKTLEEAAVAVRAARERIHGEFANHG